MLTGTSKRGTEDLAGSDCSIASPLHRRYTQRALPGVGEYPTGRAEFLRGVLGAVSLDVTLRCEPPLGLRHGSPHETHSSAPSSICCAASMTSPALLYRQRAAVVRWSLFVASSSNASMLCEAAISARIATPVDRDDGVGPLASQDGDSPERRR